MLLQIERNHFFTALQRIIGVVEKRQTLPVLDNILFEVDGYNLKLTTSDTEIETQVTLALAGSHEPLQTTIPARKLFDIVRAIPDGSTLTFEFDQDRVTIKTGRSRFKLSTLSSDNFPLINLDQPNKQFSVGQQQLKHLIDATSSSMAVNDVRYYLNGMLMELESNKLRVIATDGHRLSCAESDIELPDSPLTSIIISRKSVLELSKQLHDSVALVHVEIFNNAIHFQFDTAHLVAKLLDGRFPDYRRVIPDNQPYLMVVDTELLKTTLQRVAILANDKVKGIQLALAPQLLTIQSHNNEEDEAQEEMLVDYNGETFEVGFNVSYLLDALNAIRSANTEMHLKDSLASLLIEENSDGILAQHVIMPMKI